MKKKGVDLLIRAFREVVTETSNWQLVIAGPGQDEKYCEMLTKIAARDPRIHFVGALSDETKWGALRSAEALALFSHQENFGIVVAEAMAAGKPVLTTKAVNTWREVERYQAGIVDEDTLEGCKRTLKKFISLPDTERVSMGKAAKIAFNEQFDVNSAADDIIRVIEEAAQ